MTKKKLTQKEIQAQVNEILGIVEDINNGTGWIFEFKDKDNKLRKAYYNFEDMSAFQINSAKTYMMQYEDVSLIKPTNPNDFNAINKVKALNDYYASLFVELETNSKNEDIQLDFDESLRFGKSALKAMTGKEYQIMEACKQNFLLNIGAQTKESTEQLANLIKSLEANGVNEQGITAVMEAVARNGQNLTDTIQSKNSETPS